MKTVLVICESGYWHDLRKGLAAVEIGFLGFDKKKPRRSEIDQLVAQADFVMIRNLNVAHASVRFAKEAAKASDTPFWIGSNFGVEKIIEKLKFAFPEIKLSEKTMKPKMPRKKSPQQKLANPSTNNSEEKYQLPKKAKNLALKSALKDFKVTEEEVDFAKMFKP
ncbi:MULTISPECIES: DUF2325 domain-containing protein [Lactococcus]|uniref:DUF2325 domain-containing protein n=1 Tax=Lactococcus petauri TaxID=1940789 RepID=UPI0006223053|nr:DUF2325 domain-containing protein [Lactococcus petauri]KKF91773.1 hypothetical protein YA68_01725 [Lactococcus garvieae]MDC0826506.1 DUF2325 domain-containing protein [Lactococcus petauri]MDG6136480.1 DUF2325 domain-containing protein [Lactococcus petauri]MDT2551965.1 DUF2325 domain-containing protein [Lactococcus petauri]MDT2562205.1 DUF2325 domain-containing protein [Lactococcus petauri]